MDTPLILFGIGGALVANFGWVFYIKSSGRIVGRVIIGMILLLSVSIPYASSLLQEYIVSQQENENRVDEVTNDVGGYRLHWNDWPDGSAVACRWSRDAYDELLNAIIYYDHHSGIEYRHDFDTYVMPMGIYERTHVLIAKQSKTDQEMHILTWDVYPDKIQELCKIPMGRNMFPWIVTWVRNDGKYAIIIVTKQSRIGSDIYVIDIENRSAKLVATQVDARVKHAYDIETSTDFSVGWQQNDQAVVVSGSAFILLDLPSMRCIRNDRSDTLRIRL